MNSVRSNKDMIFISPRGKRIVFDGYAFVFQKDDERNGYSHLCPRCHNRYRGLIRKRARSSEDHLIICGVKGCHYVGKGYYVDFKASEITFEEE